MLTCAFALFACKGDDVSYAEAAADFITAAGATDVNSLAVSITAETAEGTLTSSYTTVYNADGTSVMTYEIEVIPGIDSTSDKDVLVGTVTCDANGNYSDGGTVSGTLGATGVAFDIDSDKITNYSISGDTLAVTVAAADTAAVIGSAIPSDAVVTVTKADGKIVSMTLSYTGTEGAVKIVCSYN